MSVVQTVSTSPVHDRGGDLGYMDVLKDVCIADRIRVVRSIASKNHMTIPGTGESELHTVSESIATRFVLPGNDEQLVQKKKSHHMYQSSS
jgi:hypothetical protein